MPTALIRTTFALATAAAVAACGGGSGGSFNNHGTKAVRGKTIEVEADNYYFEPSVLTGDPGQKITVKIDNESSTEHNFSIDSQHINQDLEGGDTKTVTVTMPSSGVVSFFCEYHHSRGMAGELKG